MLWNGSKVILEDVSSMLHIMGYLPWKNTISCGIPQGSILGPLLFLLYINDLSAACKFSSPILFADDTNLFFSGTNMEIMEKEINAELIHISLWLKINKLSLNVKKTHYMMFTKSRLIHDLNIKIDNESIDDIENTKF